jgi:hypothetical protein
MSGVVHLEKIMIPKLRKEFSQTKRSFKNYEVPNDLFPVHLLASILHLQSYFLSCRSALEQKGC